MIAIRPALLLLLGALALATCRSTPQSSPVKDTTTQQVVQAPHAVSPSDTVPIDSTPQDPHAELDQNGGYVDGLFQSAVHESPRMGWVLDSSFYAEEKHPRVFVYGPDASIMVARFDRVLTPTERQELTADHHLACDTKGPLAAYRLPTRQPRAERAFYLSAAPPGVVRVGLVPRSIPPGALAAARALITPPGATPLYRDTALAVSSQGWFYSFHAAYDSATRALVKSVVALHDSAGNIVAHQVDDADAFGCDGCGDVTYAEGLGRMYDVLNEFQFAGSGPPLLLLDTSTVEGRALSLVTFDQAGTYSVYRIYEYVVECILGHGEQ